ncbi:MAG: fatty acid desaturase [Chloroflexi bacterium]|nr:fatty acid desaturase [Chloroflexota bacterium]
MAEINRFLGPYQKADVRKAVWQLANTLLPYVLLWGVMAYTIRISFWLTLPVAILAAGFLVRVFILFHDCGHNSFLPSKKWNKIVGSVLGVLVFTPGEQWWHSHAIHHATSGNLDKRGTGDVTMLTVEEFYDSRWLQKLGYAFFRNPLVMFGLGPIFMFGIMHRFATPNYGKKQTWSVVGTNLAILAIGVTLSLLMGVWQYLAIQVAVLWMAGSAGIWLFYVQHQFEDSYWDRAENWNYVASALLGASFYKLPGLLKWFSGNIGYHHVHHLSPRIPNYYLDRAHEGTPVIRKWARVIPFAAGLRTTRLKLWSEPKDKMVGFEGAPTTLASAVPNVREEADLL